MQMLRHFIKTLLVNGIFLSIATLSFAHVPYFEHKDFSEAKPFLVPHTIEQSIAVYAWLETDDAGYSEDIDVYVFHIDEPARIYLELLVPVCEGYEEFVPWLALVGPELPEPQEPLPFDLPSGYGAIVLQNDDPGEPRDTFYEPFGGKSYYEGPIFDEIMEIPGTYYVYFWDPFQNGGDYVSVIGWQEIWRPRDIIRGLILTPLIRRDRELHIDCSE
jgi:hypothetical protein